MADGVVVVDARRRMAGRGAWMCADDACVERGLKRERLAHVFRKPCRVTTGLGAEIMAGLSSRR